MDEDTRLQDRTYLAAPAESIAFEQVDAFVEVKQCITRTVPNGIRVLMILNDASNVGHYNLCTTPIIAKCSVLFYTGCLLKPCGHM